MMWINFWSLGNIEFPKKFQNPPISLHPNIQVIVFMIMLTRSSESKFNPKSYAGIMQFPLQFNFPSET